MLICFQTINLFRGYKIQINDFHMEIYQINHQNIYFQTLEIRATRLIHLRKIMILTSRMI